MSEVFLNIKTSQSKSKQQIWRAKFYLSRPLIQFKYRQKKGYVAPVRLIGH